MYCFLYWKLFIGFLFSICIWHCCISAGHFSGIISCTWHFRSENPTNEDALISSFLTLSLPTLFPLPLSSLFICRNPPLYFYLFFYINLLCFFYPSLCCQSRFSPSLSTSFHLLLLYLGLSVGLMSELSCCN